MQRHFPRAIRTFKPAMAEIRRGLGCASETIAWLLRKEAIGQKALGGGAIGQSTQLFQCCGRDYIFGGRRFP